MLSDVVPGSAWSGVGWGGLVCYRFTEWTGHVGRDQGSVGIYRSEDVTVDVWQAVGGSSSAGTARLDSDEDVAREGEVKSILGNVFSYSRDCLWNLGIVLGAILEVIRNLPSQSINRQMLYRSS